MFRIRFREHGSGSNSNLLIFFCKRYNTHNDVFFLLFMSLLFTYINKITDSYNLGWFLCEFIAIFFATRIRIKVSWSGSGSGQMKRIRKTGNKCTISLCILASRSRYRICIFLAAPAPDYFLERRRLLFFLLQAAPAPRGSFRLRLPNPAFYRPRAGPGTA